MTHLVHNSQQDPMQPRTLLNILNWTADYFQQKGIDSPRLDAEILLAHSLDLKRIQLYTQFDRPLSEEELAKFKTLLKRRADREPLAYILGKKEFYSLEFKVSPATLIPRPETELLIDEVLKNFKNLPHPLFTKEGGLEKELPPLQNGEKLREQFRGFNILEIGTGSGCIAITLAKHIQNAKITTIDISKEAIEIAKLNAKTHQVEDQITFIQQDFLNSNFNFAPASFDLLVSNPPYVSEKEITELSPEVLCEPKEALYGGNDGLDFYKEILEKAKSWLSSEGQIFLEIGYAQAKALSEIAKNYDYKDIKVIKDYSALDRILQIKI